MAIPEPSAQKIRRLRRRIRVAIAIVVAVLLASGITVFPMEGELRWLTAHQGALPDFLAAWLSEVSGAVTNTNARYPFLAYGYDWLAFAHIVIALAFVGPLRDPVRNRWVIDWAMLCCVLVLPLALIAGPARSIPFFHQVIDAAFGVIGLIPLWIIRRDIRSLERLEGSMGAG